MPRKASAAPGWVIFLHKVTSNSGPRDSTTDVQLVTKGWTHSLGICLGIPGYFSLLFSVRAGGAGNQWIPVATELSWAIIMGDYQQSPCHCSQDSLCWLCTSLLSSPAPNEQVLEVRGFLWLCAEREYLKSPVSARDCTAGPSLAKNSSTETFPAAFPAPASTGTRQRLAGPGRTLLWLSWGGEGTGLHPVPWEM